MSCLHLCPHCARHVKKEETTCPFCASVLPADFGVCTEARAPAGRPLTRAALVLLGATAIGACGKSGANDPASPGSGVDIYGPAPVADAGGAAPEPLPVAVYGPPPMFDAGEPEPGPPPRKK